MVIEKVYQWARRASLTPRAGAPRTAQVIRAILPVRLDTLHPTIRALTPTTTARVRKTFLIVVILEKFFFKFYKINIILVNFKIFYNFHGFVCILVS